MAHQTPPPPPQYGQPQYGPPKKSRGPLVLVVVLGLVLVVVLAVGAVVLLRANDSEPTGSVATKAPAPEAVEFRPVLKNEPGTCNASPATPAADGTACGPDGIRYTLGEIELNGSRISKVETKAGSSGSWVVALTLDAEGARSFSELTADLSTKSPPRNQLAIVVSDRVVMAPVVNSAITGGEVEISSDFTREDAEKLAEEITG